MKKVKAGRKIRLTKDPKKEEIIKLLIGVLARNGTKVRREELKSGPGWRAVSGSCVLDNQPTIFLDRKIGQEDQITFLIDKIKDNSFVLEDNERELLPSQISAVIDQQNIKEAA